MCWSYCIYWSHFHLKSSVFTKCVFTVNLYSFIVINYEHFDVLLMQLLSERLHVTLYLAIFFSFFNFCISFLCNILWYCFFQKCNAKTINKISCFCENSCNLYLLPSMWWMEVAIRMNLQYIDNGSLKNKVGLVPGEVPSICHISEKNPVKKTVARSKGETRTGIKLDLDLMNTVVRVTSLFSFKSKSWTLGGSRKAGFPAKYSQVMQCVTL